MLVNETGKQAANGREVLSINITEETLEQTHAEQAWIWWRKEPGKGHGQRVYLL